MHYVTHQICSFLRKATGVAALVAVLFALSTNSNAQTGTTETRPRRVPAANGTTTSNDPDSDSAVMNEVTSDSSPTISDKSGPAVVSKSGSDQVKPDRITLLRTQIRDAKTEMERVRLQRTLVDYLIALGMKSEAAAELKTMLAAENLDAASYYNIGNGLARLGDKEQAVAAYRKALDARQGNYARALNNLGVVLLDLGRPEEAYDAFVLAIKQQNFRYAEASFNLGKLYAMRSEADLAISEWTRALAVQPDHVDAAIALARAYAVTGKPGRGLEVIDTVLKRTGSNDRLNSVREEIASNGPK